MLNRAPIFLNCFSRGGSNLLWNVFLSHPEVCSPIQETLEIFRLDYRAPTLAGLRVALRSVQPRFFDQWNLQPRKALPPAAESLIDEILHQRKMRSLTDPVMSLKTPTERYSRAEVTRSRLVAKNNNGLAILSEILLSMYDDAVFIALVRHPVALYESHKRRHLWRSPQQFGRFFNGMVAKMLDDEEAIPSYSIFRFEDLVGQTEATVARLYRAANLDRDAPTSLRFKAKPHFQSDGSYGSRMDPGSHVWLSRAELAGFFEPRVNTLQASRLDADERRCICQLTSASMERLGYTEGSPELTFRRAPR